MKQIKSIRVGGVFNQGASLPGISSSRTLCPTAAALSSPAGGRVSRRWVSGDSLHHQGSSGAGVITGESAFPAGPCASGRVIASQWADDYGAKEDHASPRSCPSPAMQAATCPGRVLCVDSWWGGMRLVSFAPSFSPSLCPCQGWRQLGAESLWEPWKVPGCGEQVWKRRGLLH